MGVDDANEGFGPDECLEHEWGLEELHLTPTGADMVSTCIHCGAVDYEPSAANDPLRRPL